MSAYNWSVCPKCKKETLDENYEIGTDAEGKFTIFYSCDCSICGFSFRYEHSQNLMVPK